MPYKSNVYKWIHLTGKNPWNSLRTEVELAENSPIRDATKILKTTFNKFGKQKERPLPYSKRGLNKAHKTKQIWWYRVKFSTICFTWSAAGRHNDNHQIIVCMSFDTHLIQTKELMPVISPSTKNWIWRLQMEHNYELPYLNLVVSEEQREHCCRKS